MSSDQTCEWDLIDWILRQRHQLPPSISQGIGDDCAVFDCSAGSLAITKDLLLENVHFRRRWTSPYFLGRKSLLVSLSDLAAVGARPYACLLGLGLPPDLTGEYFRSFIRGFLEESKHWDSPLIGGDMSRSDRIHVSVTAWGTLGDGIPLRRSAGRDGDAVLVIGEIGLSRLGLEILNQEDPEEIRSLESEEALENWAGDQFRSRCLKAHLLPHPHLKVGQWLRSKGYVNAAIDVSDGLVSDLLHIAKRSQLAAQIEVDRLLLPKRGLGDVSPLEAVLEGGEDYALLVTISDEQLRLMGTSYPHDFPPYRVVGSLTQGKPAVYLERQGKREEYVPQGFGHFR